MRIRSTSIHSASFWIGIRTSLVRSSDELPIFHVYLGCTPFEGKVHWRTLNWGKSVPCSSSSNFKFDWTLRAQRSSSDEVKMK